MCSLRVSPSVALVLSKVLRVLAHLLVRRNALAEPVTHANISAAELSVWHVTMLDHLRLEGCLRKVPAASAFPGRQLTVWDCLQGQCSGRDSGQRPGSRAQVRCPLSRCKCSSAPHSADAFTRRSPAHAPVCRSWAGHGMRRLQHVTMLKRGGPGVSTVCCVCLGLVGTIAVSTATPHVPDCISHRPVVCTHTQHSSPMRSSAGVLLRLGTGVRMQQHWRPGTDGAGPAAAGGAAGACGGRAARPRPRGPLPGRGSPPAFMSTGPCGFLREASQKHAARPPKGPSIADARSLSCVP